MVFGIQKLQNDIFCLTEERDYFQSRFLEQVSEIQALKDELKMAKKEITRLRQEVMNNNSTSFSPPPEMDQIVVTSPRHVTGPGNGKDSKNDNSKSGKDQPDGDDDDDDDDDDASSLTAEDHNDDEHLVDDDDANHEDAGQVDRRSRCGSKVDIGALDDDNDDGSAMKDDDSAKDIRQSAEKLLQWASYRSSLGSHRSPSGSATPLTDHSSVMSPLSSTRQSLLGGKVDDLQVEKNEEVEEDDDAESEASNETDDYSRDDESQDQNIVPSTRAGMMLQKFENVLDKL